MSTILDLKCTRCEKTYSHNEVHFLCSCGAPLFARYDMDKAKTKLKKENLLSRQPNMWRYWEMLPIVDESNIITLGEGFTPLVSADTLGKKMGLNNLWIKDETSNPTGSFKARGMSAALSKAKELGVNKICLPTAGNAGGAAAAYGALGSMEVLITMPQSTPNTFKCEADYLGSKVIEIDGSIADAGKALKDYTDDTWYNVSTLKEPYRVEGKKTLGYELAEQMNWKLPDVILYPTGGGTGLIGMWKAFDEMEELGWISSDRPRMVSVQADGCAPIVRAYNEGKESALPWENPETVAAGLRVPGAVGDFLMLKAIRESEGTAISVSDEALMEGVKKIGKHTGIFSSPEGGAVLAAAEKLGDSGFIKPDDIVVLFLTGSGLKYTDTM